MELPGLLLYDGAPEAPGVSGAFRIALLFFQGAGRAGEGFDVGDDAEAGCRRLRSAVWRNDE